jgi:REP element-mobilizing transposase RayT
MKDHVHILILHTKYNIGYIVNQLKSTATKKLNAKNTIWTQGYWKVFIDNAETLQSAIKYIKSNPASAGMPEQKWNFISPIPI